MAIKRLTFVKCMVLGLLLTSVLTQTSCRSVTSSNIKEYKPDLACKSQTNCDSIVSVVQSTENDHIYLATKFTVKKLDSNLSLILDRKIHTYGSNTGTSFMLMRGSDLILCINDEEGTCELWDAVTLDQTIEGHNRTMVINPGEGFTVAWIDREDTNGSDFINIAIPTTYQKPTGPTIPLVSTRILPQRNDPNSMFLAYLEDRYGTPKSFLPPIPCVATDIEPVYGFSTSRFNYILKRHRNENGRIENKLARKCKHSPTYRSYIELPVECYYGNNDGNSTDSELTSAYFTNGELYAVFTTTHKSEVESFVCRYNITKINQEFTARRRECLLGGSDTTELEWYQYNRCPSKPVPSSEFNISRLNDPDFCYDLDTAHPLGGSKPIVEKALDNLKMKEVITAILVIPKQDGKVYLLGDKEGYLHKISADERGVLEFDMGNAMLPQNGLILSNDKTTVYATSNGKIMAVSLTETWTTTQTPKNKDGDGDDDDGHKIPVWVSACIGSVGGSIVLFAIILAIAYVIRRLNSTQSAEKRLNITNSLIW